MTDHRFPNEEVDKIGAHLLTVWTSMGMIDTGMVGGSVRRMLALVKDLEIIVRPVLADIPEVLEQPNLLKSNEPPDLVNASMFEEQLGTFLEENEEYSLGKRDGPKYKILDLKMGNGNILNIDTFLVPDPRAWGVQIVIRTGPGLGFNKPLMQWLREIKMHTSNGLLHNHPKYEEGHIKGKRGQCPNDQCPLIIPCPTEESFFHALQLPWIPPAARAYDTLIRAIAQRKRNLR